MHAIDSAIVVAYLLGVFALGSLFFRGQRSLADYFLGQRQMPWWAAAFSGIATILGAISFLGAPGQAFHSDLRFHQNRLGPPLADVLDGRVILPCDYRLQVFSIYEYLESRFDLRTRLWGGGQFFLLKFFYLSIGLYAPSLLFVEMTGLPLWLIVIGTGCFITLYTTLGGIKAVIWTDTLQLLILLAGLTSTGYLIALSTGGLGQVWNAAAAAGKLRLWDLSVDWETEYTILNGILGGALVLLSQYGVNQAELQKMMTTDTVQRARLALICTMTIAALVGAVYFLIGAGLWVFYHDHPEKSLANVPTDRIFAKFILEELPPGFRGLLLAAVASAAMSAASSVLNSLATVASSDFLGRLSSTSMNVTRARYLTAAIGLSATLLALGVHHFGNILVLSTKLQNFFGGSLTGAFLLGMTSTRATAAGAFWGMILGTASIIALAKLAHVSWLWHGLFAAAIAYGGGYAISLISQPGKRKNSLASHS
ncbi:MAG: sodium:solute symporter family transporter [Acidobacteriota bacterium]